eukprot:403351433
MIKQIKKCLDQSEMIWAQHKINLTLPFLLLHTGHAFSIGLNLGLVHDFRMTKPRLLYLI